MPSPAPGTHSPMVIDRDKLAASIALALDALAAAAEALAEAAKAMSEAGRNAGRHKSTGVFGDTVSPTPRTDPVDGSVGNKQVASLSLLDEANQPSLADQPSGPRSEGSHTAWNIAPPTTHHGFSSQPTSQNSSFVVPHTNGAQALQDNPALLRSPEYEPEFDAKSTPPSSRKRRSKKAKMLLEDIDSNNAHFLGESQNLGHAGPSANYSSGRSSDNVKTDISGTSHQPPMYPRIEPGRNYIRLGRISDSLAFIAHMAMQSHRTVCVLVQYSLVRAYAKLLETLTNRAVVCPSGVASLSTIHRGYLTFMKTKSPSIMLLPPECLDIISLRNGSPDCFIHWGPPLNPLLYVGQVLGPSPPTLKSCVIISRTDRFDSSTSGVVQYPEAITDTIFAPKSPCQQLHNKVVKHLPTVGLPVQLVIKTQDSDINAIPQGAHVLPWTEIPVIPPITQRNTRSLPPGNYYIIRDNPSDLDLITLIAFVALNSNKVTCCISGKSLTTYQQLINAIASVNAVVSPTISMSKSDPRSKKSTLEGQFVLLRPTLSGVVKKHDGLIYCGTPKDLDVYFNECKLKVTSSYMILTNAQHCRIASQLDSFQPPVKVHPYFHDPDGSAAGPLMQDLQSRLLPFLS